MPRPLSRKTPIISISLTSDHHFSDPSHECSDNYRYYGQPSEFIASRFDIMKTIDHRTDVVSGEDSLSYQYFHSPRLSDITEEDEANVAKDGIDMDALSISSTQISFPVEAEGVGKWPGLWKRLLSLLILPCGSGTDELEDKSSPVSTTAYKPSGILDKIRALF